jgi:hypothetical protein
MTFKESRYSFFNERLPLGFGRAEPDLRSAGLRPGPSFRTADMMSDAKRTRFERMFDRKSNILLSSEYGLTIAKLNYLSVINIVKGIVWIHLTSAVYISEIQNTA